MTVPQVYLLAGLISLAISLIGMFPDKGGKRAKGTLAQFIFGLALVVIYFFVLRGTLV